MFNLHFIERITLSIYFKPKIRVKSRSSQIGSTFQNGDSDVDGIVMLVTICECWSLNLFNIDDENCSNLHQHISSQTSM